MLFVYYKIFRVIRRIDAAEKQAHIHLEDTVRDDAQERIIGRNSCTFNCSPYQGQIRFKFANKFKSSTVLGVLVISFTICWLPFFVLAVVRTIVGPPSAVPDAITFLFVWLGYVNSLLDPIIQAILIHDFRKSVKEILCCRCSRLNATMREIYYRDKYGTDTSRSVDSNDMVVEIEWLWSNLNRIEMIRKKNLQNTVSYWLNKKRFQFFISFVSLNLSEV